MTATQTDLHLPFDRPNVLELAPLYDVLRREAPVAAVTTPAGDPAWLVTRFEEVRDLLGDKRFGRSHPYPEKAAKINDGAVLEGPSGNYETEEADHTRMRRLLTPAFSAKRMRQMGEDVQALVDGYVDEMIAARAADGRADLHETLAVPLPVSVICRLLGVPQDDSGYFRDLSDRMATYDGSTDAAGARAEFGRYMAGLAEQKRGHAGEDVISDLVEAQENDEAYDYEEMIRISVGLLFAGHETTVNRIGLGVLMLLTQRDRWEYLVEDPTRGPTPWSRRSCDSAPPATSGCCATRTPTSRSRA